MNLSVIIITVPQLKLYATQAYLLYLQECLEMYLKIKLGKEKLIKEELKALNTFCIFPFHFKCNKRVSVIYVKWPAI